MTRTSILAALFLLALAAGSTAASAQTSRTASGVAVAACGELIGAVLADPEAPPRLSDPQTQALFDLALPKAAALGPPASAQEFALLAEMSAKAGLLARAYILAGTGSHGALTSEQRWRAGINFVHHLPEIVRLYDFRLQVTARLAAGAASFEAGLSSASAADPAVRAGLAAIEVEVRAIRAAVLSLVGDENIEDAWRAGRMVLLARHAGDFAAFLDARPSQEIADQALAAALREQDPEIGRMLKDFALTILR
ncbi:MAG: hypothetical protein VYD64_04055 [Pseudomonadota bacterium]|nr:hypothetical protein [Pseudomonadota bacterium]